MPGRSAGARAGGGPDAGTALPPGVVDVAAAADPVEAVLAAHRDAQRISLLTSGSAGRPRRVLRTTASWFTSFGLVADLTGLDASSRMWLPGRFSSTLPLFAAVLARHVGAESVERPEDATHTHLTPGQLERVLDEPWSAARNVLAGLHVTVAGEALAPRLHDRALAAGATVSHYYGAAELSFVAWGARAGVLRPFRNVEIDVRHGEIWVRSPYLCEGYAPGDAGGALLTDADGFATVGDRGRWEALPGEPGQGRLVVTGRGDDAVTTGGATVLVADVEDALRPVIVGGLAVLGVPHGTLGQVVAAVLTDPADLPAARAAAQALGSAQRPRLWFHRAHLPVSDSGKTDRAAMRREAGASSSTLRRLVPGQAP